MHQRGREATPGLCFLGELTVTDGANAELTALTAIGYDDIDISVMDQSEPGACVGQSHHVDGEINQNPKSLQGLEHPARDG
jgi:hypothetical protein